MRDDGYWINVGKKLLKSFRALYYVITSVVAVVLFFGTGSEIIKSFSYNDFGNIEIQIFGFLLSFGLPFIARYAEAWVIWIFKEEASV